jgi:hypothetical protein
MATIDIRAASFDLAAIGRQDARSTRFLTGMRGHSIAGGAANAIVFGFDEFPASRSAVARVHTQVFKPANMNSPARVRTAGRYATIPSKSATNSNPMARLSAAYTARAPGTHRAIARLLPRSLGVEQSPLPRRRKRIRCD